MTRKEISPEKKKAVYAVCIAIGIVTLIVCIIIAVIGIGSIEKSPQSEIPSVSESVEPEIIEQSEEEGWTDKVSTNAQLTLNLIAEDMAKQAVKNPFTVDMKSLTMGYAKNGHLYAVQGEFECANLMGVTETHTIRVICESNEDESKIQPCEVWIDGTLVATHEGYESEVEQ